MFLEANNGTAERGLKSPRSGVCKEALIESLNFVLAGENSLQNVQNWRFAPENAV